MRFILFHGPIESLNHFTDELDVQFRLLGHETYICELGKFDQEEFLGFCSQTVHASVCYDGYGMFDKEIYDWLNVAVVNIMVVHPMNFAGLMKEPPARYIQLMTDEHHVEFVKRYYHLEYAYFAPHMASMTAKEMKHYEIEEKTIPVLFPGGYHDVNDIYRKIDEKFQNSNIAKRIAHDTIEYMVAHPAKTIEDSVLQVTEDLGIHLSEEGFSYFLDNAKLLDNYIRMYYRERVIEKVIDAGFPITILGVGWKSYPKADAPNVTVCPAVDFAKVFPYMEQSEITLTIMPWFKAGSHERILNSLVHNSCPLTDGSTWLLQHFLPDQECAYYSLEHLYELPEKISRLLEHPELQKNIIGNGSRKVLENYTSRHMAELIIDKLEKCFGITDKI